MAKRAWTSDTGTRGHGDSAKAESRSDASPASPRPHVTASPRRRAPLSPPRHRQQPVLRARIWVELGGAAALTEAGADLLEQIEACGSLSQAARRLGFAYRRAWLLVDAMNRRWPGPLVVTATGGKRGGGSRLTELGRNVLRGYRDLQLRLEHLLDEAGEDFRAGLG